MRETTLPSPGILTWAHQLRRMAALAISAVEISSRHTPGGKSKQAKGLQTFFTACATALNSYVDSVLPTVTTRVRTATNTCVVTFSETLNASTSVPLTSVVFSPVRTVTAIVVSGTTMTITATGVIATDTITYTQPAAQGVADASGNLAASFSGAVA